MKKYISIVFSLLLVCSIDLFAQQTGNTTGGSAQCNKTISSKDGGGQEKINRQGEVNNNGDTTTTIDQDGAQARITPGSGATDDTATNIDVTSKGAGGGSVSIDGIDNGVDPETGAVTSDTVNVYGNKPVTVNVSGTGGSIHICNRKAGTTVNVTNTAGAGGSPIPVTYVDPVTGKQVTEKVNPGQSKTFAF